MNDLAGVLVAFAEATQCEAAVWTHASAWQSSTTPATATAAALGRARPVRRSELTAQPVAGKTPRDK